MRCFLLDNATRARCTVMVLLLCLAVRVAAQATNPAYIADVPSVERVRAEIHGSDATDSLARQVALFNYLGVMLDRMRTQRGYSAPWTPDELRITTAYRLAAYQGSQDYAKSHTAEEAKAFERLHGQYEMDSKFYDDWYHRLLSPQFRAVYEGDQAKDAAHAKAHFDAEQKLHDDAVAAQNAPASGSGGKLWNDPAAKATRRCLELGGTDLECLGKAFSTGLLALIGGSDSPVMKAFSEPGISGLRMGGTYKADNGIAIAFSAEGAAISGCGKLVSAGGGYTVSPRGNGLLIEIANQPQKLAVAIGPSGQMAGPGPVDITGQIITGYRTLDVWKKHADGSMVPGSLHQEQEPVYGPKTERCVVSSLRPVAATASDDSPLALISGMFGGDKSEEMKQDEQHPTPAGARMSGIYTSAGGLRMEFHPVAVILDCGEAHTLVPYAVGVTASGAVISVANKNAPFTVTLQANGTLAGAGSVQVAGRLLTGQNDSGFVYQPRTQSCALGTVKQGEGSGAAVAGSGPAAMGSGNAPATANARLSVVASIPGVPNALAGARVVLMKDLFNNVLRSVGVGIPANATPGQAMVAWVTGCKPPTDCKPLAAAISPNFIGRTNLDAGGKGIITVAVIPGRYYVMASGAGSKNEALFWDLPVDLQAGDNSITLSPANAEVVH